MADMVNNPPHYGEGTYQVINVIEAWGLNYRLGNVVKYVARADRKGHQLQDLKKAAWYLQREIKALEKAQKSNETDSNGIIVGAKSDWRAVPKRTCRQPSEVPSSTYISVYTDITKDPYQQYSINAYRDWTIEALAGLVATMSKEWACGTFTLLVGAVFKPENTIQVNRQQTVSWLLENFPPNSFNYYLQKVGP